MSVKQAIRAFMLENFLFTDDESAFADDDSFLTKGIINSMGALEIVQFIEDTFGISVDGDEILPDNLDSVNKLVAFVARKQGAVA